MPYKQKAHPANKLDIPPVELPVTDQWTKVKTKFTIPDYFDNGLGFLMFSYQGPGTIYLDNLRIYRDGHPYGLYPQLTLDKINESDMRFMRTHELIKTMWGYTLEGMTNAACGNNYSAGRNHTHTFFTLLDNMKNAGNISPWLQIEMCLAEEEWLGFVEWMCAPYDPAKGDTPEKKPWAHKRYSMGQKKPWIEEFPEFALEISNETWNQSFKPYDWDWGMAITDGATGERYSYGATYGLFNEYVINILRQSPYWTKEIEDKTKFMLCGWTAAIPFGGEAAKYSPSAHEVTYANYVHNNGLGDPKVENDFKRFYVMQWPLSGITPNSTKSAEGEKRMRSEGRPIESGVYEYGYAYFVMPGDPKEAKETDQRLARSMIGAVAILDAAMTFYRFGMQDLAFFTFGHTIGAWGSHTLPQFGGHPYPFWKALTLFNKYGTGTFLQTDLASVPTWDFPEYEAEDNMHKVKRKALPKAPLVSVHATTNDDRVTVFLISRKIDNFPVAGDDGFTPATIKLPFDKAKKITLHKLAGDPRADDRFKEVHKVESVELNPAEFKGALTVDDKTGADQRGLPPASIFCYVFEGTNLDKVNLPPTANFTLPKVVVAGEPATIRNLSTDPDGGQLSNAWKLGSLGASNDKEPKLNFNKAGIEQIELTTTDPTGLADSLKREEQLVSLRFQDALWTPRPLPPWMIRNISAQLDDNGALNLSGKGPIQSRGTYSVLVSDPRYRQDFTFEAVIDKVKTPANDKKAAAGLVLISELNEGLGFGWSDYQSFLTPASLLVTADGAVRVLAGKGDQTKEKLPPGSVTFPARLRLQVEQGVATAAVQINGQWKDVAQFPDLANLGLIPGIAAGSSGADTTATISELKTNP